ncbi:hypothetical protein HY029_02010 [Candidatus Gottesmanbacteria bacterium]|nr:hypothetical protein [Candidatus Gottesmanbacteria bacterium]
MVKKHKTETKDQEFNNSVNYKWWVVGVILFIVIILNITGKNSLVKSIFNHLVPTPTPTPKPIKSSPPEGLNTDQANYVKQAIEALAAKLKTKANNVKVVSVKEKQWNDSSLGCPQKGMLYIQSITPGYIIELSFGQKTYIYHGGLNIVISC